MNPLIKKSHNRSSDLHCDHFDGTAVFSSLPLGAPNYVASVRLSDLLREYFKSSSSLQSAFLHRRLVCHSLPLFFLMVKDFPSLGSKDIFMICKQLSARFWLAKSVISLNLLQ